uniref:C2H2-type domain-containing protein n=1 Tax=Spongospora subterranea TaxID=70186 RepID=A0A0H5QJD0_9EUKA|eukprot:CRZ02108.1 hypothetical protein [Spongospora subterranea]
MSSELISEMPIDPVVITRRPSSVFQIPCPVGLRCTECCKRFARRIDLDRHFRLHTGQASFSCSKCPGLRFPLKSQLKAHSRIHLKTARLVEPQFGCPLCHKSFENRWSLTRHQIVHSTEKPHRCTHCERSYSHRYQLTRHMRTSHGINRSESEFYKPVPVVEGPGTILVSTSQIMMPHENLEKSVCQESVMDIEEPSARFDESATNAETVFSNTDSASVNVEGSTLNLEGSTVISVDDDPRLLEDRKTINVDKVCNASSSEDAA